MSKNSVQKNLGPFLYSESGDEEGVLIDIGNGKIIAWFYSNASQEVSLDTLIGWVEVAKDFQKTLTAKE